jgi:demethylmenaquinone methyltransferase / 2-methoxy-6-polyprenyl-1,4-benzoquinol methylase
MAYPLNEFYSRIYKRYDIINRLFTFGMDQSWRKEAVRQCLNSKPEAVLDLCCGTGNLSILLAEKGKGKVSVTGFDRNTRMLEIARQKSTQKSFLNIRYVQGDALQMPFAPESFDAITIGFGFRNLTYDNPHSSSHILEMHRVLKRGGNLFILESGVPENRWIRFFFKIYLIQVLIPIGFILSGDLKAYSYLAHSASDFFPADEVFRMLSEQGFEITARRIFFLGAASLITAKKR